MSFPTRNSKTVLIQKAIDKISRMDDTAFNRFTESVINLMYQNYRIRNEDIAEIVPALNLFRTNPDEIKNYIGHKDFTSGFPCTLDGNWFPGCFIILILFVIYNFPYVLIWIFSSLVSCWYPTQKCC